MAKNKTVIDTDLLPVLESIPFESVQETDVPVVEDAVDGESTSELPQ